MTQTNLTCTKEITGSKGDILFTTGLSYSADIVKNDSIRIKDNIGCIQNLPKKVWENHFGKESE